MVPAAVAATLFSKPRCPYEDAARGVPRVLEFLPNGGSVVYTNTTATQASATWADVSIGTPHPDRIVVVSVYTGTTGQSSVAVTVNGSREFISHLDGAFLVAPVRMPGPATVATVTVTLTGATSDRKAIAVYAVYPRYPLPLDESADHTPGSTGTVTLSDLEMVNGGCLIWGGGIGSLTTTTVTWANGGGESPVVNVDNLQPFSPSGSVTLTAGNILAGISNPTGDLSMTATLSGTRRLCALTFGPPVRYP